MRRIIAVSFLLAVTAVAGLERDALKYVPRDWVADTSSIVTADFDSDGTSDIALVYYRIDHDAGEFNNRINRILVSIADGRKLRPVIDQYLPYGEDFGSEIDLEFNDGLLLVFQHMGFMHRWNEWGLSYDAELDMFWEARVSSGGLAGLGFAASSDFRNGTGYISKVWDEVNVSAHYAYIYSRQSHSPVEIDGRDSEAGWQDRMLPVTAHNWITYGDRSWDGFDDAAFSVRSLYDEQYCYFYIEARDDEIITPSSSEEIPSCDHVELWVDRLTWETSEETGYYPQMWDRLKDPYVAQFALACTDDGGPLAVQWLPDGGVQAIEIELDIEIDSEVSTYEVAVPWRYLGIREGIPDFIPVTVVYSDSDNRASPGQESLVATSELIWADPFTFGYWHKGRHVRNYWGTTPLDEDQ